MSDPRNPEALCHLCAAFRVNGADTDALQDAVADWLSWYDENGTGKLGTHQAHATELLALIARTAKQHKPPAEPLF